MNTLINFLRPVDFLASLFQIVVLAFSVALLLTHQNLPPAVPLWFSKPWGSERLAQPSYLWLIPTLILVFFVVSNLTAKLLGKNYLPQAKILVWSSAFISTVFLLSLYKIVLLAI